MESMLSTKRISRTVCYGNFHASETVVPCARTPPGFGQDLRPERRPIFAPILRGWTAWLRRVELPVEKCGRNEQRGCMLCNGGKVEGFLLHADNRHWSADAVVAGSVQDRGFPFGPASYKLLLDGI